MSAVSSRPPIPRPTARRDTVAPPESSARTIRPASPISAIPKAYASTPPVIRDRMPTLELADDDVLEAAEVEAPPAARPRSTPPPPPPMRSTLAPKDVTAPEVPKIAPLRMPRIEFVLDPTDVLFEGMYELEFVESEWQAASLCAAALGRALGARAVIVHSHDLARRELRAIGVHGDDAFDLLGLSSDSDDDLVASAVICNEKPVTMRFDGDLSRLAPRRLGVLGAPRTLVAVPALAWGRCVGLIEIIDADDRLAARVVDATAYVAERLAAYLSSRAAA